MAEWLAVVYLRVSTQDQGRTGYSLQEQEIACRRRADELAAAAGGEGAQVVVFQDDVSGDLDREARHGLDDALTYCREHRPHLFVCYDPDRLSRSTALALSLADDIERMGARLAFVLHEYEMTPEGRLFFTLRAAVGEYEKAKILERTSRGKRGARRRGRVPNRVTCYGYDFVTRSELERTGERSQLRINPGEAWWVREIFRWVREERLGPKRIADRLGELGVPTKLGKGPWNRGVIHALLRNRIYIGELALNRWNFTGLGKWSNIRRDRRPGPDRRPPLTPRRRRPSEWVVIQVPPILTAEAFADVQSVLAAGRRTSERGGLLLSGIARCGACGGALQYSFHRKIAGYYLRCAQRARCRARAIRADEAEREVWTRVCAWLTDAAAVEAYANRSIVADAGAERVQQLEAQVSALEAEYDRWVRLVARGRVGETEGDRELERIAAQVAAVRRELAATAGAGRPGRGLEPEDLGRRVQATLAAMSQEQRRFLVRALVDEVRKVAGAPAELAPGWLHAREGALQPAGL